MIIRSYAKINLAINIKKRLENNYHLLDMVMAKIDFYDKLTFTIIEEDEIIIESNNKYIPLNEKNLVYQVIDKVKKAYDIKQGVKVYLKKNIPSQAGLGGGSSNAASTMIALNKMFSLNLTKLEMIDLVKDLGADIPFFFYNSMARVQGIGDEITPISNNLDEFYIALIKPNLGISTQKAYELTNLDTCDHPNVDLLIKAIKDNDYDLLVNNIGNSLQESAIKIRPIIEKILNETNKLGFDASLVSGSGSTIFALTKNYDVILKLKKSYLKQYNFIYITKLLKNK